MKIEESEKGNSCRESSPGHLWFELPEVSWVRLLAAVAFFTFLYFRLITSKFFIFQHEARCSEQLTLIYMHQSPSLSVVVMAGLHPISSLFQQTVLYTTHVISLITTLLLAQSQSFTNETRFMIFNILYFSLSISIHSGPPLVRPTPLPLTWVRGGPHPPSRRITSTGS